VISNTKAEIAQRLRDEFESLWFLYPEETFEAQFSGAWERVRKAVDDAVDALSLQETKCACGRHVISDGQSVVVTSGFDSHGLERCFVTEDAR
jgi:hypothetical protein